MKAETKSEKTGNPPPLAFSSERVETPIRAVLETITCKVIEVPTVTSARIYWFSCLLPEASHFKVNELPVIKRKKGELRLLVIAGNLSHFAGDMTTVLLEHWLPQWDHVFFVPGPYDYGKGTACLGDDYCLVLQQQMGPERFTVFIPGETDSVFFKGLNLRILGAPCWPTSDLSVYKETRVYEPIPFEELDGLTGSALEKARVGILNDGLYLGKETAEARLKRDVATLVVALRHVEDTRQEETRIVVTYGCPDEQLSLDVKHNNPFRGTVTLGSPAFYTYFGHHVDYWIHGAAGDNARSNMGRVTTLCNLYTAIHHSNGDGFGERIENALVVVKKKKQEN